MLFRSDVRVRPDRDRCADPRDDHTRPVCAGHRVDGSGDARTVVRRERPERCVLLEPGYQPLDSVDFRNFVTRAVSPVVLIRGWPDLELGEVDEIDPGRVLHVEPRAEPLPAGLQPLDPEKVAAARRNDGGSTALRHLLGRLRVVRIRNNLFPEREELAPEIDRGP